MEDTQEIDEVQEEVISDKTSEKEEETRDEVLARHRWLSLYEINDNVYLLTMYWNLKLFFIGMSVFKGSLC